MMKREYQIYFENIHKKYEKIIIEIKQLKDLNEIRNKFEEEISKNLSKNDIRNMYFFNYRRIDIQEQSNDNIFKILSSFSEYVED